MLTGRGVGLVLSGGGARGFAHIGIVKALREASIPIDLVGGTSMGAILGAGVSLCWTVEELKDRFRSSFVAAKPLRDYTLPFVSLVSGRKVTRLLQRAFGDVTIEDLPLDFFCVSSNLSTGHSEVHRRGELWRWLRASVAIPGVLPPVVHKGELLVDGGTMNNLPVDAMRELGRGPVIGCDVGADRAFTTDAAEVDVPLPWQLLSWMREKKHRPNIFQILWRAGMVNSSAMTAAHREKTDLLLQPPLAQIDMLNWNGFDRAIATGYEYAVRRLEKLPAERQLAEAFGTSRTTVRMALDHLENERLVTRRVGSGTFVNYRPPNEAEEVAEMTSPVELIEVRLGPEPCLSLLIGRPGRPTSRTRPTAP